MARLPEPGGDEGNWGIILNDYLSQAHDAGGGLKVSAVTPAAIAAGAITTIKLADDSITEQKLSITNTPATNQVLSWNGSGLEWVTSSTPSIALDNLSDVAVSSATDGQVLIYDQASTQWIPGTATSTVVNDATTSSKGIVQLAGDLAGTADAPTVPGLSGKVDTTRQVGTSGSLTGGGALSANLTLSLSGDSGAPGNSKYYGTDGSGTKGYFDLPSGSGDPAVGGDISGTASNAQIVAGAVGATELATDAVTTTKIADANVTAAKLAAGAVTLAKIDTTGASSNQVLTYDGANAVWQTPSSGFADPTTTKGDIIVHGSSTGRLAVGSDNQVLTADSSTPEGVKWAAPAAGSSGFNFAATTVTSATYTASLNDYIFADASATGITITLPTPQLNGVVRVQAIDNSSNSVQIVAPGGAYINGPSAGSITTNIQFQGGEFWSDGSNWFTML